MADIAAAREHVQRAVAFLVSRFGYESDVFEHLTHALENLKDDPVPVKAELEPEPVFDIASIPANEAVTITEAEMSTSQEPPNDVADPEPAPARRKARRKR